MHKLRLILLSSVVLTLASIMACTDKYDDYSTNPNDILSFSADTLSFDTIISTVTTPTGTVLVYNPGSKPLLISSVGLVKGAGSPYNMVVDGVSGERFEQVEIGARDSIFVYINVKLDENGQVKPVLYEDQVVFITNGIQQKVVLQAYGQDAYIWHGKVFEESDTLPNNKPYLIYDSLEIKEGATLTIQEGTTFYMHSNARIKVFGKLTAKGSIDHRIVFRGDRMDNDYMVNIPYDRLPGQWNGIHFYGTSFGNELDYVYIRNGYYGLNFDASTTGQLKLKIKNSIVTNVKGTLISAAGCWIEGENCEFSNSQYHLLYLEGGKYNFTHCTMANYYFPHQQWGSSSNPTIGITNRKAEYDEVNKKTAWVPSPLEQADFVNCIIYGPNSQGGIALAKDTVDAPSTPFNYSFLNCLVLYDEKKTKDKFTDCIFNENPRFLSTTIVDQNEVSIPYDFRIDSISPARNVANVEAAQKAPSDLNGISRFSDEGPDAGAYEYTPKQ